MQSQRKKSRAETQNKKWGDLVNHHGEPPTYKGRQKQKEKETMGKQSNQKAKDKIAVANP